MTTRRLLHLFAGVPDEMLRSIGLIAVLSARLDFIRMQILEEADQVPVTSSAEWPRRRLTDALISASSAVCRPGDDHQARHAGLDLVIRSVKLAARF